MESSRRFKEAYLTMDDEEEDSPGNSNAVETRLKIPPDKLNPKGVGDVGPAKSKKDTPLSDSSNRLVRYLFTFIFYQN